MANLSDKELELLKTALVNIEGGHASITSMVRPPFISAVSILSIEIHSTA